jgi:hypothetical protein
VLVLGTAYNPSVSTWFREGRLVRASLALLLGAVIVALFLIFFDEFVGGINRVLIFAMPLLLLTIALSFIATIVGAVGLALYAPVRKLVLSGSVLTGVGVIAFGIADKTEFGFDDPRVVFAGALVAAPLLVGLLLLSLGGIRHWRTQRTAQRSQL